MRSTYSNMWNPWRRVTAVVVRAGNLSYACHRDGRGWRCGRCDRGWLVDPRPHGRCPVCSALVVAVQRGVDAWVLGLLVLLFLAGWLVLVLWTDALPARTGLGRLRRGPDESGR